MFKKTRRRIVAAIMSILVVLWAGTLGIIYASSYLDMVKRNEGMLKEHAERYTLLSEGEALPPPEKPFPLPENPMEKSPVFRLSMFYTVALSPDGSVLETQNGTPDVYTDEELEQLAQRICSEGRKSGAEKNLTFYSVEKEGYTLVAFKDNTVINEGAMTLFRYTLIFGGLALVVFFFLSVFLARKIVAPLESNDHKQKQFISDAGHELKTPVSVVGANAELLARELGENQWLANIRYENERMGVLVGQLLDLARTESVELQKEPLELGRLVRGEALPFESVAFEKGLALNCDAKGGIVVHGNGTQLKQLVSILLDNAIRHSKEQGEVTLRLTAEHGTARLSVINRGEAIPADQREQIFERFYRMDPARNREERHYGLGLAIAKAIVVAHGGRIGVHCADGTVEFRVQLPIA